MNDNEFWLNIWRAVGTFLAVVIVASQIYSTTTNHIIQDMVADGADPLEAACAVSSRELCAVVAARK